MLSRENGRVLNRLVLYVTLPATNLLAISSAELSWGLLALSALFFLAAMALWIVGLWPARAGPLSRR
jgi:predicted permease